MSNEYTHELVVQTQKNNRLASTSDHKYLTKSDHVFSTLVFCTATYYHSCVMDSYLTFKVACFTMRNVVQLAFSKVDFRFLFSRVCAYGIQHRQEPRGSSTISFGGYQVVLS